MVQKKMSTHGAVNIPVQMRRSRSRAMILLKMYSLNWRRKMGR